MNQSRPGRLFPLLLLPAFLTAVGCREGADQPAGPESEPLAIGASAAVPLSFRQISTGVHFSCGVTGDDRAWCWGLTPVPSAVATDLRFKEVRVGLSFTCGLTTESLVYCWGTNSRGQLGDGTSTQYREQPAPVAGGRRYRLLRTGLDHACAITRADVTFCWGANDDGKLGDGTTVDRRAPRRVAGGLTFLRVATGAFHTCGVTPGQKAYCWGRNSRGQLGDGTGNPRYTPVAVKGGLAFDLVSAGGAHTCGVTTGKKAYCWGLNRQGQLGDGTNGRSGKPVPVAGGLSFSGVGAGGSHTCGVTTSKAAYCWGWNWYGQLGEGTNATEPPFVQMRFSPVAVLGGLQFEAVLAAKAAYTCGIAVGGRAYCWGLNQSGELGDGTETNRSVPTPVAPPL